MNTIIKFKYFNQNDLHNMDSRDRALFINSLSGFKSANLIGSQNSKGQTNLAMFSSVVHLGASPALVAFIMRPDNGKRHTLDNIKQTKQYTINQVSEAFYDKAHQTSAAYSQNQSEFESCGLTTEFIDTINAPFVGQSRLKYAVSLKQIIPIELNATLMIIGEITHIICDQQAIQSDGFIDIESINTVAVSSLDSYHKTKKINRLHYAKPDKPVQPLVNIIHEIKD